eukprot:scaffold2921_cov124-Isochrysis_galbana.AAC.4
MVRSYFRYTEKATWGLVVSGGGRVVALSDGRTALSPMLEDVCAWSIRHGGIERRLRPAVSSEVTALELSPTEELLAVGYADGSVRLWSMGAGVAGGEGDEADAERVTLSGHRGAVLSLSFSSDGAQLASGGSDTLVVLWDVVGEAGICKLRGHRGAVTGVALLASLSAVASVSKDGSLRLWDLHTQHCVQACHAPSGELWAVCSTGDSLLTGGAGGELLLWAVARSAVAVERPGNGTAPDSGDGPADGVSDGVSDVAGPPGASTEVLRGERLWMAAQATLCGALPTSSSARVALILPSRDGGCVGVQFADRTMGMWRVRDGADRLRRASKRKAEKARKRKRKDGAAAASDEEEEEGAVGSETLAAYEAVCGLRSSHKLHSFAFLQSKPASTPLRLLVAQRDNSAAVWEVDLKARSAALSEAGVATPAGHKAEPRAVALSGDDAMVASVSDGEARVWSLGTRQCTRSLGCGYGLSVAFVGSNQFVAVGTKAGALQLFELATGDMLSEESQAHGGAVWGLDVGPRGASLLSASADKTVCTWALVGSRLVREQSIEVGDDAMCASLTPDGTKALVGLLDATVKLVDLDSQKTLLLLYGHKLPVRMGCVGWGQRTRNGAAGLCPASFACCPIPTGPIRPSLCRQVLSVAASSDGQLAASVSADKSLKLWGLDFGDLHRSIYAHTEPVTAVAWVPKTHYLFTAGKDGLLKHWDADTYTLIHVLRGHHAEVWGLAVGRSGAHVVSASRDRSIRLWTRSAEQVFLEEEREAEVEAVLDASLEKQQQAAEAEEEEAAALGVDGRAEAEAGAAGRRTLESVKGAERVLEALKTLDDEDERVTEYEAALARWQTKPADRPQPVLVPNLLLLNLSPSAYLLRALGGVRTAELEQALLLLPFDAVRGLLTRLLPLLEAEAPIELMARCVLYLLRVHHKAIVANRSLLEVLQPLAAALHGRVARERATLGYNLAALGFVKRAVERAGSGSFFDRAAAPTPSVAELRRRTAAREKAGAGGTRKKRAAKVAE